MQRVGVLDDPPSCTAVPSVLMVGTGGFHDLIATGDDVDVEGTVIVGVAVGVGGTDPINGDCLEPVHLMVARELTLASHLRRLPVGTSPRPRTVPSPRP
jgi:hypothetical protein